MDKYEERRLALRALRDELGHGGIRKIAEGIGKDPSYVSRMMYEPTKAGYKRIGEDSADALDIAFPGWMGDSPAALIQPSRGALAPGYVRLEHLSPQPSMGRGAEVSEPVQIVQYLDVLEQWVRQSVGSSNPNRIKVLTGNGNSMEPTIKNQDLVFVDIECRTIDTEGIYVLDVAGRFLLKKVLLQGNRTMIVRSDNVAEYPDEERYDLRHYQESIIVCGKVLAWWTLRKG